jgi:hypothetical protein
MRRYLKVSIAFVAIFAVWSIWQRGCKETLPDISVGDGMIVVRNQTAEKWTNIRVWVNEYYSGEAREIPAGGFIREPVGRFVASQNQTLTSATPISSVVVLGTAQSGARVRVVWGKPFWH